MPTITSYSEEETFQMASVFAKTLRGGEIIALNGDLGAGKTVFVKGLAHGLGIQHVVTSPTFVLMKVYQNKRTFSNQAWKVRYLVHVDAYRLNSSRDLIDIGMVDFLSRTDTVVAIEWADKVKDIFVKNGTIWIRLQHSWKKHGVRLVRIEAPRAIPRRGKLLPKT